MLCLLFVRGFSVRVTRSASGSDFIKLIDDSTMRDTIKKVKNSFVFFHADHQRLSDVAYGHYVSVAKQYRDIASFFVVPASAGSDVARTYSVPGNPSLLHFRLGTRNGLLQGLPSRDNIERFVANWTSPPITSVTFSGPVTVGDVWQRLEDLYPNHTLAVLILADNSTKFGRAAFDLADELGAYFPFVAIPNSSIAHVLNARYPSLVLVRFEDRFHAIYKGEADVDDMFIWAQHNSVPQFRNLDTSLLFSPDGVSVRSVVAFVNRSDVESLDEVYLTIGNHSNDQNWIKFYYADIHEHAAVAALFGVQKTPSILFLSANYTHCGFAVGQVDDPAAFRDFFDEKTALTYVRTPRQMYGSWRPVTEFAFEKMADEGPFFAIFSSSFCVKCKPLKQATLDAVETLVKYGADVNWAFWDVTVATPSFQRDANIGIPSVWFFKTANVSQGEYYVGQPNHLSIIEWVHGKVPDAFDLDQLMTGEIGGSFDEI
jgi:hypothetical protein